MKRELNLFVRLLSTLSAALFAFVAIRRVLIDLQEIFGIRLSIDKKRNLISAPRNEQLKTLKELTQPAEVGGLSLGTLSQAKLWSAPGEKIANLPASARERNPHVLIVGSSRVGKSAYLASLVKQDIQNDDRAVVVMDADGDLINSVLQWMASNKQGKEFAARTTLLEPGNQNCKLGYNPMLPDNGRSPQSMATAVLTAFQSISVEPPGSQSQFNAQSANILFNSILLLIANGKSICDLSTLLCDNDFRDILLESIEKRKLDSIEYPRLLETWSQYKRLARTDQWIVWTEPILNRVGPAMADSSVKNIITSASNDINFEEIISQKQILLVNFDSSVDSMLLGNLLIAGLKDAATTSSAKTEKKPTALFIDNLDRLMGFHSFEALTSKTSRNQIGIVGTLRNLHSLPDNFRQAILTTVGRIISFAVAQRDASLLGPLMFRSSDIEENTRKNFFASPPERKDNVDSVDALHDQLVYQEPFEFFCCSLSKAGAFKIKAVKPELVDDRNINKELLEHIRSNSHRASTRT